MRIRQGRDDDLAAAVALAESEVGDRRGELAVLLDEANVAAVIGAAEQHEAEQSESHDAETPRGAPPNRQSGARRSASR